MIKFDNFPTDMLDPGLKTGLILCGMGGPDGTEAVRPFLRNLFRDPAIFPLPRLVAPLVGAMIARKRSPEVAERYLLMDPDGKTPQLQYTLDQARLLAGRLQDRGLGTILPDMAMRYWRPFPDQTVARLLEQGARQFLVVPTYPQYSHSTNGSTLDFVRQSLERLAPGAPVHMLTRWHALPGYIDDLTRPVVETLGEWARQGSDPATCALIYAAHSLPQSFVAKGDPYEKYTRATMTIVHNHVKQALEQSRSRRLAGGAAERRPLAPGLPEQGGPHQVAGARAGGRGHAPGRGGLPAADGAAPELRLRAHRDPGGTGHRAEGRGRQGRHPGIPARPGPEPAAGLAGQPGPTPERHGLLGRGDIPCLTRTASSP